MRIFYVRWWVSCFCLALVGCGAGISSDKIFLPTYNPGTIILPSIMSGRIDLTHGCIYIVNGSRRWHAIWPHGTKIAIYNHKLFISYGNNDYIIFGGSISIRGGEVNPSYLGLPDNILSHVIKCGSPHIIVHRIEGD